MKLVEKHLSPDFNILELYPVSDLHVGIPLYLKNKFEKFIKYILAKENRFIVCAGDLTDNATRTSVGNPYEATMSPQAQKEYIIETIYPARDRILFISDGNHEARNVRGDGQYITRDFAFNLKKLDEYCPEGGFLQITFGRKQNGKRRSYLGYITHGSGGGITAGAPLNKVEKLTSFAPADFYIMGHFHRKIAGSMPVRYIPDPQNHCVRTIEPIGIVSSSWMAYGEYAQFKLLPPHSQGTVPLKFWANKRKIQGIVEVN